MGGCIESVKVAHLNGAVRGRLGAGCVSCFVSEIFFLRRINEEAVRG